MHNGCLGVKVKVLIFVLRVEVKLPEKYSAGWRSRYLVGLITRRSLVRVQPPLPREKPVMGSAFFVEVP